jgi:3'5'-cyclic nucleotide phosphodiesterase
MADACSVEAGFELSNQAGQSEALQEIESRYRANSYHNAMHAADVTQSAMVMIAFDNLAAGLTDLELLCIILSCCIHDVGHYGVNNDFLVKTQHEWALVYNDTSVNENMHVRVAFEVLQMPECNIFEGVVLLHLPISAMKLCIWPGGVTV